ncbi:Pyrimidine pathway regulatory protein 1 [Cyphellophora attinorum]|uniref:Pyrimidine pathway regulatory protein 1 n=1 Tax=Cyphellophora attinorum TaxID=1664694 RepID=A0A0N1P0L8_9EURO|nr:Pyrimidine pathway regulatory protein 1 [Phialophora attinorum]KPI43757.1 Pyrimidine pathway regulatory protein 1 [Phialophora attinorum]
MDETTNISEAELTRLLPTCQRCRRLRRKCDTQLPACRLCQKGKAECTFFDHALQQNLPRSYVHELLIRLSRLRAAQSASNGGEPVQSTFKYPPIQHSRNLSAVSSLTEPPISAPGNGNGNGWGTDTSDISFDKHFILRNANPTCWQFFGSSSAYSLAIEVIVHAQARLGQITFPGIYSHGKYWLDTHRLTDNLATSRGRPAPDQAEIDSLFRLYSVTTNSMMNVLDLDEVYADIPIYLRYTGSNNRYLSGSEAYQFFRISMVCAIAAANKGRHHPEYIQESLAYYSEALECVEEVTSDVTVESLQALMLLIFFALFHPRKGDIWKLLDFACRLSVELNYHSEPNDEFESEKARRKRRGIFWALYTVERTIGQHFGRPADLTEEIITAEYPVTIHDAAAASADPEALQFILSSHYYRLTYMRSEIFRELYLPVTAPELPREWYELRLSNILSWRRELEYLDQITGVGAMTCEMGFDSSICFLFQPLVLRALATTKEAVIPAECLDVIPRESYHSACRVIDFYDKLFRGSEDSPEGQYPISILSAHYIHQAALTIMAHCLLAIDGRLPVVNFSSHMSGDAQGPVDFHGVVDIAQMSLELLDRLGKMFAGMIGLFDVCKTLHDKVLPAMERSGFINRDPLPGPSVYP